MVALSLNSGQPITSSQARAAALPAGSAPAATGYFNSGGIQEQEESTWHGSKPSCWPLVLA